MWLRTRCWELRMLSNSRLTLVLATDALLPCDLPLVFVLTTDDAMVISDVAPGGSLVVAPQLEDAGVGTHELEEAYDKLDAACVGVEIVWRRWWCPPGAQLWRLGAWPGLGIKCCSGSEVKVGVEPLKWN